MPTILGFTKDQTSQLSKLSRRQLEYWNKTGFFSPEMASGLYSFRNLVGLRTISELRNVHKVPLQELRQVGAWLASLNEAPWANLNLYVAGKHVLFEDPTTNQVIAARPRNQSALKIGLLRIANDTERDVGALQQREPAAIGQITQKRTLVQNQPVVAGTRIPTSAVWNLASSNYTTSQIIEEYPSLTSTDIEAALEFERLRRVERAV